MNKNEKKVLIFIVSLVFVFTAAGTAVSFLKMPQLNADNSAQISIGQAKQIVLDYAGVDENDVAFTKIEADIKRGVREYDFEFSDGTTEFEYKMDAHTGDIISSSSSRID